MSVSHAFSARVCLYSTAITADANDLGNVLDALRCSRLLTAVDVSGNPVSNPQAQSKLARVFAEHSWPALQHLNLSSEALAD